MRPDREDTSAQSARVTAARQGLGDALAGLEAVCRGADVAEVAAEARALRRALASRARRPPAVDVSVLLGLVSAAEREAARDDGFDAAVRRVRDAERELDLAAYDLATARGEDG